MAARPPRWDDPRLDRPLGDRLDGIGESGSSPGGTVRTGHAARALARETPCVHCRRWRIFLAGVCAGVVALALHATAGPPSSPPVPKPRSFSLDAPELQPRPAAAAASEPAAVPGLSPAARPGAMPGVSPGVSPGASPTMAPVAGGDAAAREPAVPYPLSPARTQPDLSPPAVPQTASVSNSASASAAAAAPAASSAKRAPDLRLVYVSVPLPSGRIDTDYKPREVVQGGRPPYHIEIEGTPPPGLRFGNDGSLSGRPTRVGNYSFALRATDSASPPMEQEQHYVLRILPPVSAAPAAVPASTPPAKPAPSSTLQGISLQDADGTADVNADVPVSYLLTAKDLDDLVPPTDDDKTKATSTAVAPSPPLPALAALRADLDADADLITQPPVIVPDKPTPAQLRAILAPLVGVEYPSRGMFTGAVEAERCRYYLRRVAEVAAARGLTAPKVCPRPAALRSPSETPAAPRRNERVPEQTAVPLEVFFDSLLAEDNLRDIVVTARKLHPVGDSRPLRLSAEGCQCAPGHKDNEVVGIIPFWRATETAIPINFNLFTRLQYMGVVLRDDGRYDKPNDWDGALSGFSREAQRYDVAMDLVIYRRSWANLLNKSDAEQTTMIKQATDEAMNMLRQQRDDPQTWMNRLLIKPGADSNARVFGGLTLFFEDTPTEGRDRERYTQFLKRFVDTLLAKMQKDLGTYRLNLVVPDQQLGEQAPYSYEWLIDLKLRGDNKDRKRKHETLAGSTEPQYSGTGDVTVQFLVMMSGDPDTQKKNIRRSIDLTRQVQGVRRIDFLDSLLPVVVHATSPEAAPANITANMARDFPYIEWNYGGITLWPLPLADVGMGSQVISPLTQYFLDTPSSREKACGWICPNRLPLRLLAQTLLIGCFAAALVYGLNCRVRQMGLIYLVVLGLVALLAAALCLMLLTCDPALSWLRDSPYVPVVALVLVVVVCIYLFLQFRAPEL